MYTCTSTCISCAPGTYRRAGFFHMDFIFINWHAYKNFCTILYCMRAYCAIRKLNPNVNLKYEILSCLKFPSLWYITCITCICTCICTCMCTCTCICTYTCNTIPTRNTLWIHNTTIDNPETIINDLKWTTTVFTDCAYIYDESQSK